MTLEHTNQIAALQTTLIAVYNYDTVGTYGYHYYRKLSLFSRLRELYIQRIPTAPLFSRCYFKVLLYIYRKSLARLFRSVIKPHSSVLSRHHDCQSKATAFSLPNNRYKIIQSQMIPLTGRCNFYYLSMRRYVSWYSATSFPQAVPRQCQIDASRPCPIPFGAGSCW